MTGGAQGLHVAVAQGLAHGGGADEGRVADDEIRPRPVGLAGAGVAPLRHLRGFVGHGFTGDGVRFVGGAVPAAQQPAGAVIGRLLAVPGQHGVAACDVAVVVHHGLGHAGQAARAHMPLQPAYPQHQLGERRGARVQLQAQQLLQGDGFALEAELALLLAQLFEQVHHLALQALQMLQCDVEKVGAAAGRVQHAQAAQAVQKVLHLLHGFLALGAHGGVVPIQGGKVAFGLDGGGGGLQGVGLVGQRQGGGLGVGPFGAQRGDDGGQHQALDIGARGVVGPKRVALGGVEGALEQGAEDGGLDLAPVGARGLGQQVDLRGGEQQAVAVLARALEELAVEVQHVFGECAAEAAPVHVGPEDGQHFLQRGGLVAVDAPAAAGAVAMPEGDGAFEHVVLRGRGVGPVHPEQLA